MGVGAPPTAATVSSIGLALTVFAPVTDRWKLYLSALFLKLAGTITSSVTVPLEQGLVAGNPGTTRLEEKTQLVALAT
jgi:hypothetical protein